MLRRRSALVWLLALAAMTACSGVSDDQTVQLRSHWLWRPDANDLDEWQLVGRQPTDMVAGNPGELILSDTGNSRVLVFTHDGKLVQAIGRQGQGPGEFARPTDLLWDAEHQMLWVGNQGRIARFLRDKTGFRFLDSFPSSATITDRATSALALGDSTTYWANMFSYSKGSPQDTLRIKLMDLRNTQVRSFGPMWSLGAAPYGLLLRLNEGVLVGVPKGRLMFAFCTRPVIELWSKSGSLLVAKTLTDQLMQWEPPKEEGTGIYFTEACWVPSRGLLYLLSYSTVPDTYLIYGLNAEDLEVEERFKFSVKGSKEDSPFFSALVVDEGGEDLRFFVLDSAHSGVLVLEP
jgi:hypothetical protein